jgi:hypothetical protein
MENRVGSLFSVFRLDFRFYKQRTLKFYGEFMDLFVHRNLALHVFLILWLPTKYYLHAIAP